MIKLTEWLEDIRMYPGGEITDSGALVRAWVARMYDLNAVRWPTMPHKVMVF